MQSQYGAPRATTIILRAKIDNFQDRAFRFGFLKDVTPVTKMLESSDRRLWKSVASSTGGPLVDLLPSVRSKLLRRNKAITSSSRPSEQNVLNVA